MATSAKIRSSRAWPIKAGRLCPRVALRMQNPAALDRVDEVCGGEEAAAGR
jgi:hypothetical protein